MRMATGKVVGGKVVVEGAPFDEGAIVTVLARDADEAFDLTHEQRDELLAAIAELDRGQSVDASDLLKDIRAR